MACVKTLTARLCMRFYALLIRCACNAWLQLLWTCTVCRPQERMECKSPCSSMQEQGDIVAYPVTGNGWSFGLPLAQRYRAKWQ